MQQDVIEQAPVARFQWGDIDLSEVIHIRGTPYVTRQSIGEWLEYADPQKAIDNILARNLHIEEHSVPLKLRGTDGKKYETRVYHPIGFLLIVMESGQPMAKLMKRAVAEFVWKFAGPQDLTRKERLELLKHRRVLLADLTKTGDAGIREALATDLRDVSLTLGLPVPASLAVRQLALAGMQ